MELDQDIAEPDLLTIAHSPRRTGKVLAIAQPHNVERLLRRQHRAMAGARMVGMAMGDHGPLDRAYRIDVEIAGFAVETGGNGAEDVLGSHLTNIGRARLVIR